MNKTEEKEYVNPFDYTYDQGQLVGIDGNGILSLLSFLQQVIDKEPKIAALLVYPGQTTEIKDDDGKLVKVEVDWKEHNATSFFFTAADDNGGVPIRTELGMKAEQLLQAFTIIHQVNINNKIAKKQEQRNDDSVFKA